MGVYRVDIHVLNDDYSGFTRLLSSHGLSVFMKIYSDTNVESILFDVGPSNQIMKHNSTALNIDLSNIKSVVLSHRHYDHTGGLKHVMNIFKRCGKRLTVISHPWIFRPSIVLNESKQEFDKGMPYTCEDFTKFKTNLVLTKSLMQIAPSTYYLGEIGNYYDLSKYKKDFYTILDDGELVPDDLPDDSGVAIKVDDLGLIIISGCSHSGIVNIAKHASEVLKENIYAVIGGFHMLKYDDGDVVETVNSLKELGVMQIYTGHCTGFKAEKIFSDEFKDNYHKIHSGFKFSLKREKL
ncbi:MAG: MBL fold metallo-hydrolase [Sulfolobales archaeon]|nr:MBL fold metallo-hydrolase [Sulfolobales archaeon]MCX8186161.1 MBL fold metallo-hydrolase [Sulfolobales archaeon]